jgi:hypothetical protein
MSRQFTNEYYLDVQKGNVAGTSIMNALGERENVGTTATGEDIWRGSATVIPIPIDAGEQMEVVSSDAADGVAGTGVLTIRVHYLDATGAAQTEDVTTNGTTGVALSATNVRFVNDMYTLTVGTNGVAEGDITIYKQGAAATVYNLIALGGNKSLVPTRMVPLGNTFYPEDWNCTEAQGKRQTVRIRSTDMYGTLIPRVFCFKGIAYLSLDTSPVMKWSAMIPALSIIKVSSWAIVAGGEVSVSWWGYLVED